ncbi:hypothetical protein B4U80_05788 [Leptotrombidium deliense]|uniref:Cystatin domain-containing protein n=1 Tax=Leptotrombidium deliense TaxID=299467 RepID=A0A443S4G4_9ACAR|nr:hypothetical protein B4U80_05788 [Leptotrombidium deliense]
MCLIVTDKMIKFYNKYDFKIGNKQLRLKLSMMKYTCCVALFFAAVAFSTQQDSLPGGWNDVTDGNKKNELVKFSVVHYNERSNSYFVKNVVRVVDAKQQVVSGINYRLTIELGTTQCKRNEVTFDNIDHCVPADGGNVESCTIVIWERTWLNEREVTHFFCQPK